MGTQKPSVPRGTRDFPPAVMVRRNFIFETIERTFRAFGYQPVETPAMEYLDTLLGKYGEEGDKLLYRILNSGDFLSGVPGDELQSGNTSRLASLICDRGLRYDLTVPFARYVVQHRNELTFPFKRYQIQPVWRADKPQKGRYREFYQCDADVIGSESLLNERELTEIIIEVFRKLNINCTIRLNNRKILSGIASAIGASDKMTEMTTSIDKLDKAGREGVIKDLRARGISDASIERLEPVLDLPGSNKQKLDQLRKMLDGDRVGVTGLTEMEELISLTRGMGGPGQVIFDLSLARGLNYYTGTIFEVLATDTRIGSICGGGRYDNLAGVFGLEGVSGVGVSFGADRIYDVMTRLELFPERALDVTRLLFVNFGEKEEQHILQLLPAIRKESVSAELYPDRTKLKKQMNYANNKGIPFVALVGAEEMKQNKITLKNMESGAQRLVTPDELIQLVKQIDS